MVTTKGVRVSGGHLCEAEAPTEATAETKPETTEENIMNAKTERQIENLKKQTIGVEIEMNHITRERAARLAADHFGTGRYEYTATPPAETATALGRLGMHKAENGNSRKTSALQDAMPKSANWLHRF
mgnify:CR=1 FL=1